MMTNLKTNKLKEVMYTYGTIIALILIIILFGILNPRAFLSSTNFWNITRQMAILAVIVGNIASFSGVLAALLAINGVPFIFSLIIATLLSGILGLINGYIVTKFKVMSFIITLAMGRMIYGLTYWLSGGAIIFNDIPQSFKFIGTAKIGKIPYLTILMVIISLIFIYITKYTAFGRKLYAIGGNERASKVAGVKVEFNKTLAFALSGLMAGFAGVLLASRVGSASPTAGDAYNLNAYATIFIGITLFKEGVPNILGTLVGVAIFTVLANGLTILQVPTFIQNILTGLIIIIAVVGQKVGTSNND
jgi:ribose transport system permease protein